MLPFLIFFAVFTAVWIPVRSLVRKKFLIEKYEYPYRYVNKTQKKVEIALLISFIPVSAAAIFYSHRKDIVLLCLLSFNLVPKAFRAYMEARFDKVSNRHILSLTDTAYCAVLLAAALAFPLNLG